MRSFDPGLSIILPLKDTEQHLWRMQPNPNSLLIMGEKIEGPDQNLMSTDQVDKTLTGESLRRSATSDEGFAAQGTAIPERGGVLEGAP